MSLTTGERAWLSRRDTELDAFEAALIDDMFVQARTNAALYGVTLANDDRAARLEAAMIRYILESRA